MQVEAEGYELDMGSLGRHDVRLVGDASRTIDMKIGVEVTAVMIDDPKFPINLLPLVPQDELARMKTRLTTAFLNAGLRGREAAV